GQAIRLFYQECHLSFLLYFESFIKDYEAILTSIKNQLKNFEPDPNGFISESFLDHDVRAGLHKIETTTIGIVDEANKAMKEVRDIVDLPFLDETEVVENIWRAKRHAKTTIEQLHAFDKAQTAALETVEQDLALMANYINQISSAIKSGEVTISNYSVKQITSYETYNDLIGDLAQKTNPYENKYRRPDADEQLIASSYIAQLQNKNVTKEEFETLQEQKIKTVHVIDEYAEYDGDYHILANGMIVREYKDKNFNKQYQIVDKVPKNRAGGVRELDSPFEGTPLEIAEYAVPGGLIKKGVTKLGKKAITGIEKKLAKECTGGTRKNISHPVLDNTRSGSALKKPDGQHGFNDIIDNYTPHAKEFEIVGGDGVKRKLYQIEGGMKYYDYKDLYNKNLRIKERITTVKDQNGIFEWIVDPAKGVTHRRFIPNGQITGAPNQRPKE
uniref:LXG domain-containing protein n=1 Tax=Fictibacillus gelatini TaxID=225985 RepID=UPI001B7FA5AD